LWNIWVSVETARLAAEDARHMATALALASRTLGQVWPNPGVGCVIVKDGAVVGRGWTQRGGRPHAEAEALAAAGERARGASLYVSLEPCNHFGKTPPCAEAIIAAGLARVVVAVGDPDPRVDGDGLARLREAGIEVSVGVRAEEATALNAGFFLRCTKGRPLFTLKMATSLDGRIATRTGESKWITGNLARRVVHRMRSLHDAVMIGSQTALADDPDLGCRLPGMSGRSPVRIVVDGRLRLTIGSRLVTTASQIPTWVVTRDDADPAKQAELARHGVALVLIKTQTENNLDPRDVAHALGERGLTRVLIEGGGRLAASFLAAGMIDRLVWFHGPRILGADAVPAAAAMGEDALDQAPTFHRSDVAVLGDDVLEMLSRVG
jgi:diaminohydroxyphosphoribosylaminopyrimidine deaminase/5-amino-6-(5-phosphoribosylamino)uracil reductase